MPQTYYQKHFPLLSFTYALYCDGEFRRREVAKWRENHSYRGYLDDYQYTAGGNSGGQQQYEQQDGSRGFPAVAEDIIVNQVDAKGRLDSEGRYLPTRGQAWEAVLDVISEMAGRDYLVSGTKHEKRTTKLQAQSVPARPIADRPLISCLAVLFLDPERKFREDPGAFFEQFDLNPSDEKTLRAFARGGKNFMELGEALTLAPSLVEELLKPPGCW